MKAIRLMLIVCLGGFIAVAIILPTTRIEPLYTCAGVERLEELRLKALHGDISQAASSLRDVVEYWPPKLGHEGHLSRVYRLSRAGAIREIISRMRSLSGEDLGDDPKLWIEKFYRKETTQPNKGANGRPAGQPDGGGEYLTAHCSQCALSAAVAELGRCASGKPGDSDGCSLSRRSGEGKGESLSS